MNNSTNRELNRNRAKTALGFAIAAGAALIASNNKRWKGKNALAACAMPLGAVVMQELIQLWFRRGAAKPGQYPEIEQAYDSACEKAGVSRRPALTVIDSGHAQAMATGIIPGRERIFAYRGLIDSGMNQAEIEAVLAHELSHVRHRDLATLMLSMMIYSSGADVLDSMVAKRLKKAPRPVQIAARAGLALAPFALMRYIMRAREAGADAGAAAITANPLALSSALDKLMAYRSDGTSPRKESALRRAYYRLRSYLPKWLESHPSVKDRQHALEGMSF